MGELLGIVAIAVYAFFSIRWGIRFVDGRWAWLEKPELKIPKLLISALIGLVGWAIYLLLWCVKTMEKLF